MEAHIWNAQHVNFVCIEIETTEKSRKDIEYLHIFERITVNRCVKKIKRRKFWSRIALFVCHTMGVASRSNHSFEIHSERFNKI